MNNNEQTATTNPFIQALRGRGAGSSGGKKAEAEQKKKEATQERKKVVESTMEAMSVDDVADSRQVSKVSEAAAPGGERMEAVVDLLFGNHLDDINAKMRAMEKQFEERVSKAEDEMRVRIEALDRHSKAQIDALERELETEREMRAAGDTKLEESVRAQVQRIDAQLEKMEESFNSQHEAAQKEIDDRIVKANEDRSELRRTMERETNAMKKSLSSRSELSGMFSELGKRLGVDDGGENGA